MITFGLYYYVEIVTQHDISGWLYVLPVMLDLAIIDRVSGIRK